MVQSEGNQQTVKERVDSRAQSAHADKGCTQSNQCAVHDGPYNKQNQGSHDGIQGRKDGHRSLAAEKRQSVRKPYAFVLVIAGSADETGDDTHKLVHDLVESRVCLFACDTCNRAAAEKGGDHVHGHQTGQCSRTVAVICHAYGHSDGKQP